jgi:hypothetical protein
MTIGAYTLYLGSEAEVAPIPFAPLKLAGAAALAYGAYQFTSGGFRLHRGVVQVVQYERQAIVTESPVQQTASFFGDVTPIGHFHSFEDFIAGLP